jgi:predicted DNA-binding transcriptional regulator AlpA
MNSGQVPRFDNPDQSELEPLLVGAKMAALLCGKCLRTWRAWNAAGWIPRPVRIGRSTLWRLDELKAWTAAGCPRREEWELIKKESGKASSGP